MSSKRIESMTLEQAQDFMAHRRGPATADPAWARRVALRWRVLAVVLASLAIGAIIAALLSGCGPGSEGQAPVAPAGSELPAAETPVITVGSVQGAASVDLQLLGGPVAARLGYVAVHLLTGELRTVEATAARDEGWAHCIMLTLRADLRPVLLRGVHLLLGEAPARWLAALLPRIDVEVSGPAAAIPEDALPVCEARAGRLRVLALGLDLTAMLPPSRHPAPALATEQAPD